jgi:hypothetical protein
MNIPRKYVIWGAGVRGIRFINMVGEERIAAVIDSNCTNDYIIHNFPVIDFDEYCSFFYEYIIVITVSDGDDIVRFLQGKGNFPFFDLRESISELQGYGEDNLCKICESIDSNDYDNVIVIGVDIFGLLLYEYLEEKGKKVFYYLCEDLNHKWIEMLCKNYRINCISNRDIHNVTYEIVYGVTPEGIECAKRLFSRKVLRESYDFSNIIGGYYNPCVEELRGRYSGKKCFIVANGNSLTSIDLNALKEKKCLCFGVNRIFLQEESSWKPAF